jgi:hypothetical protein
MIKIITDRTKKEILRISSTNPRTLGLKFSDWSLRSIAGYVREKKIVKKKMWHKPYYYNKRDTMREHGIEWRHSMTVLGKSRDPEYDLKKSVLKS